jgi:carbamate kinase
MADRTAVIAIGGNSLIKDANHQSARDQYLTARQTCHHIASLISDGWRIVVTHGNGPQVGFVLRRSELAASELPEEPLDVCGADTQGAIGYVLQQNLRNELACRGIDADVVALICQTEVAADDPAFGSPSKPIGAFMTAEQAERRRQEGWHVAEDANRGWRRVVPSPRPLRLVEMPSIRRLIDAGTVVIAAGGGGIPVVADEAGTLRGVAAVIDKDLASAMLASQIGADLFAIATAVPQVALDFGTPRQRWVSELTLAEAKRYLAEGSHFAAGSMAPKIAAVIAYLEAGGKEALITAPTDLQCALAGQTGTRITPA